MDGDFEQLFLSLLKSVSGDGGTVVDQERLDLLRGVCRDASEVFGESAEVALRLHPEFCSGGVVARTDNVVLSEPQVQKLKEILQRTDVFSIDGYVNNTVSVSFTVQHVFKS